MTLKSLIYDIWSVVRGGSISDDDSLSELLITEWILQTRTELLRQQYNKGQSNNPDLEQVLDCVELIQADASECNCYLVGCNILKTKKKIPHAVEVYQGNLITRVSSPQLTGVPFSIIPFERVPYCTSAKYGNSFPKAFLHNEYWYVLSTVLLDTISIKGVFEDPRILNNFINCSGEACFTDQDQFPISAYMINIMKQRITEVDFKLFLNTKSDIKNDSKDETLNTKA